MHPASLLLALATFAPALAAATPHWPVWRGPANDGTAPGATPPLVWSESRNVAWKIPVSGLGFSTPIVWGDRLYLLTAVETTEEGPARTEPTEPPPPPPGKGPGRDGKGKRGGPPGFGGGPNPTRFHEFIVLALDRATGATVWQRTARREVPHEGKHATNSFASASPVTDGTRLYASFGSRGIYCYDLEGNKVWEKDLGDMRTRGTFGEGASPALAGDTLLVAWDHEENSFIVGLDARTGAERWRRPREERSSWSTPVIVTVDGRLQAIVAAAGRTRSYDPATGEVIWEAAGLTENVIPTPVIGHGMVYLASGFRGNAIQAVKLTARGDVTDTPAVVWSARKSAPYVPSPVLSGERLYVGKSNDAFLSCLNALTGEVHYQDQRLEGVRGLYASPVAARGHVFIVGREGTTLVIRDAARYEVVSSNVLDDRFDASPVMLGGDLYLRGHRHLYCLREG
jgi:outer membrane protein assembly factor BamB